MLYFGRSGRPANKEDLQRFLEEKRREMKDGG